MSIFHRLMPGLAGMLVGASALAVQPPQPPHPPQPPAAPSVQVSRSLDSGEGYALVDGSRDGETVMVSGADIDNRQLDSLKRSIKGPFLWFRDAGKAYVLQDAALVGRVRAAWEPSRQISAQMSALGNQMGQHGKAMGELGSKMGEHGRSQAKGDTREAAKLQALGQQQRELGRKLGDASRRQALAQTPDERRAAGREVEKLQQQMEDAQEEMEEVNDRIAAVHEREADKMETISRQMDQRGKPMDTLGKQMGELGRQQEKVVKAADRTTRQLIAQAVSEGKARPVQ